MPGSIPYGLHEGTRSEYLAQYVFASWGTAVAIPHQEDHGLDLFCTLMERVGRRAFARFPYTVQVKSDCEPWVFKDAEAVRWFVHHPLPFFFCVVDKATATLSVYLTFQRFLLWTLGKLPDQIELTPTPADGSPGTFVPWEPDSTSYPLGQPILYFSITEMLDSEFWGRARKTFDRWVKLENENLTRIRSSLPTWRMPRSYKTNEEPTEDTMHGFRNFPDEEQVQAAADGMEESLVYLTKHLFKKGDFEGAVRGALLHRHLFRDKVHDSLLSVSWELERRLGNWGTQIRFAGTDELAKRVDALFSRSSP